MTTLLTPHQLGMLAAGQPAHRQPVFETLAECGGGLVLLGRHHRRVGVPRVGPLVVLVDDGAPLAGPRGFDRRALGRLVLAVDGGVVVTIARAAWPYERTASLARLGVSTLLVETSADRGGAWRAFIHTLRPALPVALIQE